MMVRLLSMVTPRRASPSWQGRVLKRWWPRARKLHRLLLHHSVSGGAKESSSRTINPRCHHSIRSRGRLWNWHGEELGGYNTVPVRMFMLE